MILPLLWEWNKQFWGQLLLKISCLHISFCLRCWRNELLVVVWSLLPGSHTAFITWSVLPEVKNPRDLLLVQHRRSTSLLQRKGLQVTTARCAELLGHLWIPDPGTKRTFVFMENLLSDLCLETTFSCLFQWFWSISETTTAIKYKPGIFAPTDIA